MSSTWSPASADDVRVRRRTVPAELRVLLVLGILPNLLIGLATAPHGTRALVHLEYLVLVALHRFISRTLLGVLVVVTLLLDVLFSFAPVFNFGPSETVAAVEQIRHFSGRAIVIAIGVVAMVVAVALALVRLAGRAERGQPMRERLRPALIAGPIALTALVLDVANGSNPVLWRARTLVPFDVATTVIAGQYARGLTDIPEAGQPMRAATDSLRSQLATEHAALPDRIVLIVVESMGVPRGADLEEAFGPLATPAVRARYEVRTGTVPFAGATTSGEFRELCGVRMSHASVRRYDTPACLPAQLAARGYQSLAMHAYNGALFERREWYPRIGFQQMLFADELNPRKSAPRCGLMFNGPCDASVASLLRAQLSSGGGRRFVYWLTLSSHFPLDPRAPTSRDACAGLGSAGRTEEACALWSSLWPVVEGVAAIAADTSLPPAWYILVGDHAPPQLPGEVGAPSARQANAYAEDRLPFALDEVSFIELRPREMQRSVEARRLPR